MTLTGFGGVGKTRLALRVAFDLRRVLADGVYFVPLGALSDPELLPQAIRTALGLQGRSTRAAVESLTEYLRSREVLLVLDNCEHLIDASAVLTDMLLRACPRLHVLVTSREPLRIDGETVHAVAPLTVPLGSEALAGPLREYESINLFVDRAQAVVPDFDLTDANREAVADICARLEGIPLAIELAAVRLRSMSPSELAGNLIDHWDLLSRGSRTAPDRQRTMASCIEWSFELCSEAERDVWAAVSVFSDGFELDAAGSLCADLGDQEFTDVIAALVDKSIVNAQEQDGRMRFRMLPPIRRRGINRLEELGRLTRVRRLHRDWYVDLAVRASNDWMSPRQVDWINRLRSEEGNMQAAFGFCSSGPEEAPPGLLMGAKLREFGLAEGLFYAGRLWFERLLPLAPEPTLTRALALRTACWWSTTQGDLDSATRYLAEGQQLAEKVGEPAIMLFTQTSAFVALFAGDLDRAISLFDVAITAFRASGDNSQIPESLLLLALAHALSGNFDRALLCHEQCLEITEPAGETWSRAYSMWTAGLVHWRRGDTEAAAALYQQSLTLSRLINDPVEIALCFEAFAWIAAPSNPERAAILLGAAEFVWDRIETSTAALPGLIGYHEEAVGVLGSRLDPDDLRSSWDKGKRLGTSEATQYALGEDSEHTRVPVAGRRSTGTSDILTRREKQIAGLVAQGLSNSDIAANLVISRRTAEAHVENILTKLGFNSRNQITAWMADLGHENPVADAK